MGIAATGWVSRAVLGGDTPLALLLAAPMGASAVLLFAVPASPLAQPWPIVGGNVVAALSGVAAARLIPEPMLAAGVAVALAIALMSLCRCLHAPGGGTALVAALGGSALVQDGGWSGHDWLFAFVPVGLNAVILVAAGWLFHRVSGQVYPHRPMAPAAAPIRSTIADADIDAALEVFGQPLDVSREDLKTIARLAADHAASGRSASGRAVSDRP